MSVVYKQGISLNYFARPSSMRITNAIYDVIHFLLKKKTQEKHRVIFVFRNSKPRLFFHRKDP